MPFDFKTVYVLTNLTGNFLPAPMVAVGVRRTNAHDEKGRWRPQWQYLVNNDVHGGHELFGEIVRDDEDGVVEVQDSEKVGDDGKPVVWRFDPLTLAKWHDLGAQGEVIGYEKMKDAFVNDYQVCEFYREKFLPDWWEEAP